MSYAYYTEVNQQVGRGCALANSCDKAPPGVTSCDLCDTDLCNNATLNGPPLVLISMGFALISGCFLKIFN